MWEWVGVLVMGIVEGITEFLPVSSTGHLILTDEMIGFQGMLAAAGVTDAERFAKNFEVIIQLGAILAVVAAYPRRILGLADLRRRDGFAGLRGVTLLVVTSIPAAVLGILFDSTIERVLFSPLPVTAALAVGALWILAVEAWVKRRTAATNGKDAENINAGNIPESTTAKTGGTAGLDRITWRQALGVGCFQCLALWPGMSRSGSTILGGMMLGLDRRTATEYSFFVAIPVMFGATLLKVWKNHDVLLHGGNFNLLAAGFVISFIAAWIAVKWFIRMLGRHTLRPFGWYRLGLAAFFLAILLPRIIRA